MYSAYDTDNCSWVRVTDAASEPLSLDEAKDQARLTADDEDALLASYIKAARQAAEEYMSRGLITQTWRLTIDWFAESIWLPMASPLQSVTSVKYYDTAGVQQTASPTLYTVDTDSRPGRIVRAPNQVWPATLSDRRSGRVEITYVVGWTSAALIPERIKQGLRLYVTYCHSDRDGLSDDGAIARSAAEACWDDRVYWKPPAYAA